MVSLTCKGPFIATQLNSTRRRVQLSCVVKVSIATPTQLNSTRRRVVDTFTAWTTVTDQFWTSWPSEGVYSDATQLNSARRPVELSCIGEATRQRNCSRRWVELSCVYKRALTSVQMADVCSVWQRKISWHWTSAWQTLLVGYTWCWLSATRPTHSLVCMTLCLLFHILI